MPGSLTSRIRQLGALLRGFDKNSCAVPKALECKPTDSSSSWRDSRTSLSSSTMNTVGTSCVLITTRLNQKESQNNNNASFVLSPIKRRSTTPDRLYRMMQWGRRANLGVGGGKLGWLATADAHQISPCVDITGYYLVVEAQHTQPLTLALLDHFAVDLAQTRVLVRLQVGGLRSRAPPGCWTSEYRPRP